jgi:thiamine-phosphate pyrophosphorylase
MIARLPPALVALTPGDLGAGPLLDAVRRATAAGLAGILLREPEMSDLALLALARDVRAILGSEGWLGVHDRVHLAETCGADAVHVGFRSLSPTEARGILPATISIGFSAHAGDDPERARDADYLFFGPVLDTPSKRGKKEPVGFEGLAAAVAGSPAPVWGIGGIRPDHAAECLAAGAAGIAVLGGILNSPDPAAAAAAYLRALATITPRLGSP